MRTLIALMVMSSLALARPRAPKPPKPPADVGALSAAARSYLHAEDELKEQRAHEAPVTTAVVLRHFDNLHALALGFHRLERRGALRHLGEGRRTLLRHTLAQLLGESTEVTAENLGDLLSKALERRDQDLATLREVARRAFDIDAPPSS
jgi:hypothetical protein